MAKLAAALALRPGVERRGGSSPSTRIQELYGDTLVSIYGPYQRKDKRFHVVLYYGPGIRVTLSYPKFLMEISLGRKLEADETVDHIDENVENNELDNLQILSRAENAYKSSKAGTGFVVVSCIRCKKNVTKRGSDVRANRRKGKKGPYCGRSCAGLASHDM